MRCQPVAQIGGERSRAFGSRGAAFGRRLTARCALGPRVWRTDLAAPATAAAGVMTVEATAEGDACEGRGLGPSALAERPSAAG